MLEWGTRNGAAALGLGADVGSLEVGKKADLVILDARRPHLVPALRIVSAGFHNGQAGDVESVMVDGRWLMPDRRVLTIDEGDVVTRPEEIGRRVWRQLVARYPNVPFPIRLPPPVSGVADATRVKGDLVGQIVIEAEPEPIAIALERTALIIIDMQRDFLEPGGFGRRSATTSRC